MQFPIYRQQSRERMFVYDDSGNILVESWGDSTSVAIPQSKLPLLANAHVLHNHPSMQFGETYWDKGTVTLSKGDMMSAAKFDVARIAAVGEHGTYIMERPPGGWGDFEKDYTAAVNRLSLDESVADVATNYRFDMKEISMKEKNDISRQLWKEYASISGASYIEE